MDSRTPLGLLLALLLATLSPVLGWLLLATALLAPGLLEPLHKAWRRSANRVLLGSYFALVLAPLAWIFRRQGRDPLQRQRQPERDTYAEALRPRDIRHMRKPW